MLMFRNQEQNSLIGFRLNSNKFYKNKIVKDSYFVYARLSNRVKTVL